MTLEVMAICNSVKVQTYNQPTTDNHVPSCRKTFHFLWLTRMAAHGPVTPPYHTLFVKKLQQKETED